MKVALVIYTYSEQRGGAERACTYLAHGLLERGHEVHLFAHRFQRGISPTGAVRHEVPTNETFSSWKHTTFADNSKRLLEEDRFDVIHSFTRTYYQDILRLGGGTHREYLDQMESERSVLGRLWSRVNPKERAQLKLERRGFREGAYRRIVAVSNRVKEEVVRHYGLPPEDIVVIHNGVDTDKFHPALREGRARVRKTFGLAETDLVYLFCGSGGKRKGLGYAIESMAKLPAEPRPRLLVVGESGAGWLSQARRLKISDRVFMLGPRDNVGDFYGAADALVLPTLYDPFPNVCLEALATGIPIITTAVTGVAEIVTEGRDAFILEDGRDPEAIAERMRRLADPGVRASMSAAARETAERHSIHRTVEANLALYEEILKSKSIGIGGGASG